VISTNARSSNSTLVFPMFWVEDNVCVYRGPRYHKWRTVNPTKSSVFCLVLRLVARVLSVLQICFASDSGWGLVVVIFSYILFVVHGDRHRPGRVFQIFEVRNLIALRIKEI
jgi:hypothetical protein